MFKLKQVVPRLKCTIWAHGVVVSHPLSMREALGSIPSVSISASLFYALHLSFIWLEMHMFKFVVVIAWNLGMNSWSGFSDAKSIHKCLNVISTCNSLQSSFGHMV